MTVSGRSLLHYVEYSIKRYKRKTGTLSGGLSRFRLGDEEKAEPEVGCFWLFASLYFVPV